MALALKPLEDLFEAMEAGLPHPKDWVGALELAKVGRSMARRSVQNICLAVNILYHEEGTLQRTQVIVYIKII